MPGFTSLPYYGDIPMPTPLPPPSRPVPPPSAKVPPPPSARPAQGSKPAKKFAVTTRQPGDFGHKIVLWGASGTGKSSLAALAPSPVFIDIDRGTSGMMGVQVIDGVESFEDLRAAVQQSLSLVPEKGTLVLDTVTKIDELVTTYIMASKNVPSVYKLGFDRFPMAVEAIRLLLTDLDRVIATQRNVILIAHASNIKVANSTGLDFLQAGPKMTHSQNDSSRDEIVAWGNHVFHVAYEDADVVKETLTAKAGKVQNLTTARVIHTDGSQASLAKSRLIDGRRLPSVISFSGPSDDSLWRFIADPTLIPPSDAEGMIK